MNTTNQSKSNFISTNRGGARKGAGRKRIGITRKVSLTLPQHYWEEIDRRCQGGDFSISEIIRSILEDNLHNSDLL